MDNTEKVLWSIVIALCVYMLLLIGYIPFSLYADKACVENGYPESKVTWNLQMYCTRTIEQTEYVCPLDDVLANSCLLEVESGN
jgi:hypothetical protein